MDGFHPGMHAESVLRGRGQPHREAVERESILVPDRITAASKPGRFGAREPDDLAPDFQLAGRERLGYGPPGESSTPRERSIVQLDDRKLGVRRKGRKDDPASPALGFDPHAEGRVPDDGPNTRLTIAHLDQEAAGFL
jgi:hypothetical protein